MEMVKIIHRWLSVAVLILIICGNSVGGSSSSSNNNNNNSNSNSNSRSRSAIQQQQQQQSTQQQTNLTSAVATIAKTLQTETESIKFANTSAARKTTTTLTTNDNNKNITNGISKNVENIVEQKNITATAATTTASSSNNDDAVAASSITPTTYRPLRSTVAPLNSPLERERKLMNVLAARRNALHRGGFRTRTGTTARTSIAASSSVTAATAKAPTDPRSICIRNCTKNFTRRTTASCMRQCTNFQRATKATAANSKTKTNTNGTMIVVVKASSKSGLGTQQRERDTNEILFTDESSHGLFVVTKELNGTANHITEKGGKTSSGYKFRARVKPAAAAAAATAIHSPAVTGATTSFEEDDIAPYLYFGQKLPPIRPALLNITTVSEEHPKLLEVSVVSSTLGPPPPTAAVRSTYASAAATLSPVERSRSRYKYNNGRDRPGFVPFGRRQLSGAPVSDPYKPVRWSAASAKTTMSPSSNREPVRTTEGNGTKALGRDVGESGASNLTTHKMSIPSTSTPLIITVLSDEEQEEGITARPQIKEEILKPKATTKAAAPTETATATTAIMPSRPPAVRNNLTRPSVAVASSTTATTTKATTATTATRKSTTTTTTAAPAILSSRITPAPASPAPTKTTKSALSTTPLSSSKRPSSPRSPPTSIRPLSTALPPSSPPRTTRPPSPSPLPPLTSLRPRSSGDDLPIQSSLAPPTPTKTASTITTITTIAPPSTTSNAKPAKSIIEEDTERLRALAPTLTQQINTDERTNLIIFLNRTSERHNPNAVNAHKNYLNPNHAPPRSSFPPSAAGDDSSTILHTTVLTSIRSTVHPPVTRTSHDLPPRTVNANANANATERRAEETAAVAPTAPPPLITVLGSDIVTEERDVAIEVQRINIATYVLVGIGIFPLFAVIVYVMRHYIVRRNTKTDEVFDVCIADQQPISPVKKLDAKYHHHHDDDDDDDDDNDNDGEDEHDAEDVSERQQHQHHHHHHQQHQHQHHQQNTHHVPVYRHHSSVLHKQRDANYNLNNHRDSKNNSKNNNNNNNTNTTSHNNNNNSNGGVGRYEEQCSVTSDQEFDRSNIRLKSLLGEGNFGQVWKAEADDLSGHFGATRIVAVKTIRAHSAQVGLKEEASIMRKLGSHRNVVTLLGACVESEPHLIIMEYAMRGRLLSLLRAARNATSILPASVPGGRSLTPLSPRTLTGFALDIACGMEYIAERRIVHRDLAARNVLLDHNGICKICDFGMSLDLDVERQTKTLQRRRKQKAEEVMKNCANEIARSNSNKFKFDLGGRFIINHWGLNSAGINSNNNTSSNNNNNSSSQQQQQHHQEFSEKKSPRSAAPHETTVSRRPALPIRWMAPEALQYHIFTTETDIWAFGIVLWEIATLGSTPYSHLAGREVIRSVPNGLRPELPKEGRHEFYNLMERCWHREAHLRPSFTEARLEISRSLGKWVEDDSANSDYMDVSGFSEDLEHGMVYFNHRISEFECEI